MWPFSKKLKPTAPMSLDQALQRLAQIGIRLRHTVTPTTIAEEMGITLDSPVDPIHLLCVLGGESEHGDLLSDDIWHFDAECIEDHGDYATLVHRFCVVSNGALPLANIEDYVEIDDGEVRVSFMLRGEKIEWELEAQDDWVDPQFYSNMQELVRRSNDGRSFFIVALGQDSLIGYGDSKKKDAMSVFAGRQFAWE